MYLYVDITNQDLPLVNNLKIVATEWNQAQWREMWACPFVIYTALSGQFSESLVGMLGGFLVISGQIAMRSFKSKCVMCYGLNMASKTQWVENLVQPCWQVRPLGGTWRQSPHKSSQINIGTRINISTLSLASLLCLTRWHPLPYHSEAPHQVLAQMLEPYA